MNQSIQDLRAAQTLAVRLARHLATEIDLQYDTIDGEVMAAELADLKHAHEMMAKAGLSVPEVVRHVLARAGIITG